MGIIASATDAIVTIDEQQQILLFNAAAERMFLFPPPKRLGSRSIGSFLPGFATFIESTSAHSGQRVSRRAPRALSGR